MDTPIIMGGNAGPSSASTQYIAPIAHPNWFATENQRRLVVPINGTISKFKILDSNSTSGNYTYTLMKNGSATSLSCNDASAGVCEDLVNTVSITAGDTISLRCTPSSPDAIYPNWQGTMMFSSSSGGEGLVMGATLNSATNAYFPIQSMSGGNATLNLTQSAMPTGGIIDRLYLDSQGSPGTGPGAGWQATIIKNGSSTSLSAGVFDATTQSSDLSNTVSFSAGDLISVSIISVSTEDFSPNSVPLRWGVRWRPTVDGEAIQLYGNTTLGGASTTQYAGVSDGIAGSVNVTESNRMQMGQAATVQKLYVDIVSSVGGSTVDFTVMAKQTPSTMTCQITGGATTCNDTTHSYSAAFGDVIDHKLVKSAGIVAGNGLHMGIVTYIAPTATPTPSGSTALRPLVGVGQ